ncbi:MAG: hypothetical protein M3Y57_05120 [Acidobacteriota bacterium]|nr:hypothetical protein [Acidobacteriota bacterium]
MSKVEQLEGDVMSLSLDELRAFRDWLTMAYFGSGSALMPSTIYSSDKYTA